jgi:hypothetical protein
MAAYTASTAKTITLVANTVDTVTLTGTGTFLRAAQTSTTAIYFTAVPTGTTAITSTVAGDNNVALQNASMAIELGWPGTGAVISVISAGTGTVNFTLHN